MDSGVRAARFTAALLIVGSFAFAGGAQATDADDLIRQGVGLRRSGDDAGALKRFEQAFHLDHSSRALAQIGMAEQALGRWAAAYEHLEQSLEDTRDPWINKSRATLRDALALVSDHVGQLEVLGGSPQADVRIDGSPRGKLPLARPIPVSAGTVTIELVAPRFVPVQRTTVVRAHQTVRESFDALVPVLVTQPVPEPSAVATPLARPVPAVPARTPPATSEPAPAEPEKPVTDQPARGSFRPALKWIAWGAGAAALGIGIAGMVRQDQAGNDFDQGCGVGPAQTVTPLPGSTRTAGDCRSLKDRVDSNYRLELIGYVTAGALVAAGLVSWLTEPTADGGQPMALACSPGAVARGASFGCALRF